MPAEGINISLPEVSATAGTIRNLNETLAIRLEDIKKEMNALETNWQSDASNTIRTNFNNLSNRFSEYKSIIESYAKFLDSTVSAYEQTEANINNNASAFK